MPQHMYAASCGSIQQEAMQMCTPDSISRVTLKRSLSHHAIADETNAAERKRFVCGQRNSKLAQGLHAFRH